MSYTGQYTVTLNGVNVTSQVLNVTYTVGRVRITDRWTPDHVEIEILPSSTFAAPSIGQFAQLTVTGVTGVAFYGPVTDVQRTYGIPYNSGTGAAPADRVVIRAEGWAKNALGRTFYSDFVILNGSSFKSIINSMSENNSVVGTRQYTTAFDNLFNEADTFRGQYLDYVNTCMVAAVGYFNEAPSATSPTLYFAEVGINAANNYLNFVDTGSQSSATNTYWYDQIEFLSSIDNNYTKVNVSYNVSTTDSVATKTSGSAPFTSYTVSSNLNSLAQAENTANVLVGILSQSATAPFRLSTTSSITGSFDLPSVINDLPGTRLLGSLVKVTFRGTTYNVILEGFTVSQDLDQARYTLYFSPALANPLILDSTAFGILDTNTLGIG